MLPASPPQPTPPLSQLQMHARTHALTHFSLQLLGISVKVFPNPSRIWKVTSPASRGRLCSAASVTVVHDGEEIIYHVSKYFRSMRFETFDQFFFIVITGISNKGEHFSFRCGTNQESPAPVFVKLSR